MELFEEIRREYRFGVGTIQGVAKKLSTHRRMVRRKRHPEAGLTKRNFTMLVQSRGGFVSSRA